MPAEKLRNFMPFIVLLLLMGASAMSLPRLASEQSLSCNHCHINPSGGGMRTEFGNHSVALNELVIPQTKKLFRDKYKGTRISESVRYGFDSRYLILDNSRIFRMQTDFYLNLELFKNMRFQLRIGEDPFGNTQVFESYGLYQWQDEKYYLKYGRFSPNYGLRTDDHTAYTRARTGHGSNDYLDGFSVGASFNDFYFSGEIFNPQQQGLYLFNVSRISNYKNLGYILGVSLQISENLSGVSSLYHDSKSVYGSLSYDRFTLMGEIAVAGSENDSLITYINLTTRIQYGIYFISEYNFFDGNRDLKNGVDEFYRYSLEIYPIPFFSVRPSYTIYTEGFLKDEKDYFVQLHLGY